MTVPTSILVRIACLLLEPGGKDMASGPLDHNDAAMAHVERGDLEGAYVEFSAVYAALPDPARDREARESAMGAVRSVLLRMYAADRTEPEPLCRLQTRLRAHIDALVAAYPGQPKLLEIRGNEARLAAVVHDLGPFGAGACTPAPTAAPPGADAVEGRSPPEKMSAPAPGRGESATGAGALVPVPAPMGPPLPRRDGAPPRDLKIAGGVALGLGVAALGVMAWRIADEASLRDQIGAIGAAAAGRPIHPDELELLMGLRSHAQASRSQAIGVGVAAAVLSGVGVGLLVAGHRAARSSRWSASPWRLPAGGGLIFRIQLGAAARARGPRPGEP